MFRSFSMSSVDQLLNVLCTFPPGMQTYFAAEGKDALVECSWRFAGTKKSSHPLSCVKSKQVPRARVDQS